MANQGNENSDTDTLIWIGLIVVVVGITSAGTIFAPVQTWLLKVHILTAGPQVILGWGAQHIGLDLARIGICAGVALLLILLLAAAIRRRTRSRDV